MKYPVNYNGPNTKTKFYQEVIKLHEEAEKYLLSFSWCEEIKACDLYTNVGKVCCIFLFEIENSASKEDNFLWVIVGDFPPMYLDTHGAKTTVQVLENYIGLAQDWIGNVNAGRSVEDCYPFKAEAVKEMADLLQLKIDSIKDLLIPNIDNIPFDYTTWQKAIFENIDLKTLSAEAMVLRNKKS